MLHEFLTTNKADLIERCRLKVAKRLAPKVSGKELAHGIPRFLDQLIKTLEVEQTSEPMRSRRVSGPAGGGVVVSEIAATAALHGRELSEQGFTVDQVVHDYGDLCQAIADLAFERGVPIQVDEFRTLNRCLDNGIADAVTEYAFQRNSLVESNSVKAMNERLGFLAHELRNFIHTATLAVMAIKAGNVGATGATGALLDRSLIGMRNLIDRSLADVRITAGMPPRAQLTSLADFVADVKISASLEAHARECEFTVGAVDAELALDVDREMLFSAVGNLLQNAFKFTQRHTEVSLNAYAAANRIRIDVEDHCGGLPQGAVEEEFLPFKQSSEDRSGNSRRVSQGHGRVHRRERRLDVRSLHRRAEVQIQAALTAGVGERAIARQGHRSGTRHTGTERLPLVQIQRRPGLWRLRGTRCIDPCRVATDSQ